MTNQDLLTMFILPFATAVLTYLGTKRSTKAEVESVYTEHVKDLLDRQGEKIKTLEEKLNELYTKLAVKDDLIAEKNLRIRDLERDNERLVIENDELKMELKKKRG